MKVDCQLLTRALSGRSYCRLEESLLQFGGKFAPNCSNRFAEGCYNVVCRHSITFWLRSAATPGTLREVTLSRRTDARTVATVAGVAESLADGWGDLAAAAVDIGSDRTGWLSRQDSRPIGRRG
jgi:hypothetical protein